MEPQASAKAENLRFSLYGAHKALLASIELPHNGNIWYRVKHSGPPCPGFLVTDGGGDPPYGGDPHAQELRRGPRA